MRKTITLLAALVAMLMLAGCGDEANDDPVDDDPVDDTTETDDDSDDGTGDDDDADEGGDLAADLPDEWPEELPINDRAESLGNVIVEDHDGSPYLQLQYRTDEEVAEAVAFLEGLEGDGWTVTESTGVQEEGMVESARVELEGFGWDVSVSVDRPAGTSLYTHTVQRLEG